MSPITIRTPEPVVDTGQYDAIELPRYETCSRSDDTIDVSAYEALNEDDDIDEGEAVTENEAVAEGEAYDVEELPLHKAVTQSSARRQLMRSRPLLNTSAGRKDFVTWGVAMREPLISTGLFLLGTAFALGHHFYYSWLNGQEAGDADEQQWPVRFGTAFAFIVAAILKSVCSRSYNEYFWVLVKKRGFKLKSIDALFTLASDPLGLKSWEVLRHATLGVIVALICLCMTFSAVAPPATLSIVPGLLTRTSDGPVRTFDWNLTLASLQEWVGPSDRIYEITGSISLSQVTYSTAGQSDVISLGSLSNSTYNLTFYGPTVICNPPDLTTEKWRFDQLGNGSFSAKNAAWFINEDFRRTNGVGKTFSGEMLIYQSWVPTPYVWERDDQHDNTYISIPAYRDTNSNIGKTTAATKSFPALNASTATHPQDQNLTLWVRTAAKDLVCTLWNASFDISVSTNSSKQQVTYREVKPLNPIYLPLERCGSLYGESDPIGWYGLYFIRETCWSLMAEPTAYTAAFLAFSDFLNGELSTRPLLHQGNKDDKASYHWKWIWIWIARGSKVLGTTLSACPEFHYWRTYNLSRLGYDVLTWDLGNDTHDKITMEDSALIGLDRKVVSCRNGSLEFALQDLMNNITVGMLSSQLVTKNTSVPITTWKTINMYQYNSFFLLLPYGIGILLTFPVLLFGFWSMHYNGVSHQNTFSAIIATTRNPDLDRLSVGRSLGAKEADTDMAKVKLRFGALAAGIIETRRHAKHIAFGRAERIEEIEKGGLYY